MKRQISIGIGISTRVAAAVAGALALAGVVAALLTSCSKQDPPPTSAQAQAAAVPVTATNAVAGDIPQQWLGIGTVQPFSTVAVKSQIHGLLAQVGFKQGDHVKAGDLIFLIDPRPGEAARDQAVANLARDRALLAKAEADYRRDQDLFQSKIIAQSEFDQDRANVDSLKATLTADAAAITNAELQLSYCYIRSPIDGRIGTLLVNVGNVVKDLDTVLAVINQMTPTYVDFSLPERYLPAVREHLNDGPMKVEATIPTNPGRRAEGRLLVINNQVDSTGTVLLRAEFPNADELLWPGEFVDVKLTLTVEHNVVVVPSTAVQLSQDGRYLCVVKPDDTVDIRKVELGGDYGPYSVVTHGVRAGEPVITSGQLRLVQGSKVKIVGPETGSDPKHAAPDSRP